jgi:hypothetical protein
MRRTADGRVGSGFRSPAPASKAHGAFEFTLCPAGQDARRRLGSLIVTLGCPAAAVSNRYLVCAHRTLQLIEVLNLFLPNKRVKLAGGSFSTGRCESLAILALRSQAHCQVGVVATVEACSLP